MGKQRGSALGRRPKLDVGGLTSGWRREPTAEPAAQAVDPVDDGAADAAPSRANPLLGLMSAYDDDDDDDGGIDAPSACPATAAIAAPLGAAQLPAAVWTRVADGESGDVYYWNEQTGEVTWSLPSSGAPAATPTTIAARADEAPAAEAPATDHADGDDDLASVLALARSKRAALARQAAAASAGGAAAPSAERAACAPAIECACAPSVEPAPAAVCADASHAGAREPRAASPAGGGEGAGATEEVEEGEIAPTAVHASSPRAAAAAAAALAASASPGGLGGLACALVVKLAVLVRTPPVDERTGWALAALQARVEDWQAGALLEPYFAARLGEACVALEQLEARGLAPGWTRAWDAHKSRYYFARPETGEAAWELPAAAEHTAQLPLAGAAAPPPPSAAEPVACAAAVAAAAATAEAAAPAAEPAVAHAAAKAQAAGARIAPKLTRAAEADAAAGPKRAALGGRRQLEGLLSKWEAVRAEQAAEDEEARARAEPPTRAELDAQRQLELQEWHAQMSANPAVRASNPNFMPLGHGKIAHDAWRERIARARAAATPAPS